MKTDCNLPMTTTLEVFDEHGELDWTGTAEEFLTDQEEFRAEIEDMLRRGSDKMMGGGATPVVRVAIVWTEEMVDNLWPFAVINPNGVSLSTIEPGRTPEYIDPFTNSPGYDASPEVIAAAQALGIEPMLEDGQALFVCGVDECKPDGFSDFEAAAELANLGVCMVILPDFFAEQVGQLDGGNINGEPTRCEALEDGSLPRRAYAVKSFTPEIKRERIWQDDSVQFPRLLAEIWAADAISAMNMAALSSSMDLPIERIEELFVRAERAYEAMKPKKESEK